MALIAMVGAIGVGSFLFHTAATRWAWALDTGSIVVFPFAYLGFALRRFGNASWITIGACFGLMIAALAASRALPCSPDLLPVTAAAGRPCFNGSLGYLPVIAAMALVGGWLGMQEHPAARPIAAAAIIFAISLGLRTLDLELCGLTILLGKADIDQPVVIIANAECRRLDRIGRKPPLPVIVDHSLKIIGWCRMCRRNEKRRRQR